MNDHSNVRLKDAPKISSATPISNIILSRRTAPYVTTSVIGKVAIRSLLQARDLGGIRLHIETKRNIDVGDMRAATKLFANMQL